MLLFCLFHCVLDHSCRAGNPFSIFQLKPCMFGTMMCTFYLNVDKCTFQRLLGFKFAWSALLWENSWTVLIRNKEKCFFLPPAGSEITCFSPSRILIVDCFRLGCKCDTGGLRKWCWSCWRTVCPINWTEEAVVFDNPKSRWWGQLFLQPHETKRFCQFWIFLISTQAEVSASMCHIFDFREKLMAVLVTVSHRWPTLLGFASSLTRKSHGDKKQQLLKYWKTPNTFYVLQCSS